MENALTTAGVACIIAAIVGGGLKGFGMEFPLLQSRVRQGVLAVVGIVLVVSAHVPPPSPSTAASAAPPLANATIVPTSTAAPTTASAAERQQTPAPTTATSGAPPSEPSITPDGPAAILTFDKPGQTRRLTFEGTAGQQVSLYVTDSTLQSYVLTVLQPGDAELVGHSNSSGRDELLLRSPPLPRSGRYTIVIDPGLNQGSVTLVLLNVQDTVAAIVPDGTPTTLAFERPGRQAHLTFQGTAGQQVSVHATDSTLQHYDLVIVQPGGAELGHWSNFAGDVLRPFPPLPANGAYTVIVEPGVSLGTTTVSVRMTNE